MNFDIIIVVTTKAAFWSGTPSDRQVTTLRKYLLLPLGRPYSEIHATPKKTLMLRGLRFSHWC